jgi:3-oxoacyl-[acyl-carrier protein] reductase
MLTCRKLLRTETTERLSVELNLAGKRAVVTAGSAGIGLAIAKMFIDEGVKVTIPSRAPSSRDSTLNVLGRSADLVVADIATADGVETFVSQISDTDILVNNLGIYESKSFDTITDSDWFRYFEVNLLSGIRLARHYFPRMLERNWGRIIFVSSEAGAETHPDMIHYGVTKTGQLAVSRGLAEMTKGTGVTVNAVLPGPTRSEAIEQYLLGLASAPNATLEDAEREFFMKYRPTSLLQRMAEATEVASLVAYLASPLASATNGAAIRCEGGILRTIL